MKRSTDTDEKEGAIMYQSSCWGVMILTIGATLAHADGARLRVDENGVLLKDGSPYRGIGVNYFGAVGMRLNNDDTGYEQGFATLAAYDIPFARVNMGTFWPINWDLYLNNPGEWFERMDDVVQSAEEHGVGLIPSLFWMISTVPDIVGEPVKAWGDPDSETHAFMRQYTKEVVTRYKDSPAIWAWEFGNEYSLFADVTPVLPVEPDLGTPEERTEDDHVSHDMIVTALTAFGEAVREHDPDRPITTGHSIPRWAAEHLRRGEGWLEDSREDFDQNIVDVTPDPLDLGQVHIYPGRLEDDRWGETVLNYEDLLEASVEALAAVNKPVFLGEFGAAKELHVDTRAEEIAEHETLIKAIVLIPAIAPR